MTHSHTQGEEGAASQEGGGGGGGGKKQKGGSKKGGGGAAGGTASRTEFVHTLNSTACAVPRIIVAILENFQQVWTEEGLNEQRLVFCTQVRLCSRMCDALLGPSRRTLQCMAGLAHTLEFVSNCCE